MGRHAKSGVRSDEKVIILKSQKLGRKRTKCAMNTTKNNNKKVMKKIIFQVGNTGPSEVGGAKATPIFLEIWNRLAFTTPNILRFREYHARKIMSTPNILQLHTGMIRLLRLLDLLT